MSSSDLPGKCCPDCKGNNIYRRTLYNVEDVKCPDCGAVVGEDQVEIDFRCHKCRKQCDVAPMPPLRAICEDCCEDHEYEYDAVERWHFCCHCNRRVEPDWYHCSDDIF